MNSYQGRGEPAFTILDAALIDGTGAGAVRRIAVLVGRDGRILEAGPRDGVPIPAISLATGEAARALGLGRDIGTVEAGKRADLVLVRGDPARDISALRSVVRVYRDGRVVAEGGKIVLPGRRFA